MWELKNAPYFKCEKIRHYDRLRTRYLDGPLDALGFDRLPEGGDDLTVRWRDYVRSTTYLRHWDNDETPAGTNPPAGTNHPAGITSPGERDSARPPLYIILTANQRHRDAPNHIDVRLGEGKFTLPEHRFNSIPLSTLVYYHEPARRTGEAEYCGLYGVPSMDTFEAVFRQAAEDLLTHGIGFLHGRLEEFYELRRRENRLRTPFTYTWTHGLDERLQRRMADEAETKEALRRKYASYPKPHAMLDLPG